jgi:hypothetical protein
MHPSEGQLRAFHDHEMNDIDRSRIQAHFDRCAACRRRMAALQARSVQVQAVLAALDPSESEIAVSARAARTRLETYSTPKEINPMIRKMFTPRLRPVWAVLIVAVVLVAAASLPPLRAIASDFLGLFRVEQVSAIPFDPLNLPDNFDFNQQGITQLMAQNLKVEFVGEAKDGVTPDEASSLAGIPVRLPSSLAGTPQLNVQPGTKLSFKIDLPRIQAVLSDAGFSDIKLPKELDGATVNADLPMIVTAIYGDFIKPDPDTVKRPDASNGWCSNCTILVQLASPTIETPAGVDLSAIGKAYLRLTGMTADEADSFSQTIDWTTTLVIPVPNFATHETVVVDGVNGVLIQQNPEYAPQYMLIWAKDGIVYGMTGYGSRQSALDTANSMK